VHCVQPAVRTAAHLNPAMSSKPISSSSSPFSRIAFLGGYAPRQCGLATFTTDICEAVSQEVPLAQVWAGAVNDRMKRYPYPPRVRFEIMEKDLSSYRRAADYLNFNNAEVLCVQHEFGIFGGPAGSHLLAMLREVRMPVVTTLHTILRNPDPAQRKVMDELVQRSDRLVVMAEKGASILRDIWHVPDSKIDIIPHGIPDIPFADSSLAKAQFGLEGRTVLMTFGLLGPGKGIEYVIQALPEIVKEDPSVMYVILGATHPHLIANEGERYRLSLKRIAEELGVKENVIFYNRFVSQEELGEFISATDIYLTPYLNEAQITSGTLAYVFGSGKPVVSTPYWHAQELLSDGRGALVPFKDPKAIAEAVCLYLRDSALVEKTRRKAYEIGKSMKWPAVAQQYLNSFQQARNDRRIAPRTAFAGWTLASRPYILPPLRLDHIQRMSDSTGILQHALHTAPDYHHGYCTDDNARAFLLFTLLDEYGHQTGRQSLARLGTSYLAFLASALNRDTGRFRNFMSYTRQWLEEAGSEDSHGRALWALGTGAARGRHKGLKQLSSTLFDKAMDVAGGFTSPRAWSFSLLGLHEYLKENPDHEKALALSRRLTEQLISLWKQASSPDWPWFEDIATYDNARISQALILSGQHLDHPEALAIGLRSLRWLVSIQTTQAGHFRPIGSDGFYRKDGDRADFDQQPLEAQAMVSACLEAHRATREPQWGVESKRAFEWFLGRNDLGLPLYDATSGGCCDGLHPDRINENQGAESSLAFHLALAEMSQAEHSISPPVPLLT
jgi:glycosyltransferase involved in cell wall biosynthesis